MYWLTSRGMWRRRRCSTSSPGVDVLPAAEQAQFVHDFARAFQASAELGQWSVLARTITEWRSTAAIHADPALAGKLSGPIDEDFGPVPDPTDA